MRIYQLMTAEEFMNRYNSDEVAIHQLIQMYAEHVATKFAAECVNEALGNKMEVSNALYERVDKMYRSIIWK